MILEKPNTLEEAKSIALKTLDESVGQTAQKRLDLIKKWLKTEYNKTAQIRIFLYDGTMYVMKNAQDDSPKGKEIKPHPTILYWLRSIRSFPNDTKSYNGRLENLMVEPYSSNHQILDQQSEIEEISQTLGVDPVEWKKIQAAKKKKSSRYCQNGDGMDPEISPHHRRRKKIIQRPHRKNIDDPALKSRDLERKIS